MKVRGALLLSILATAGCGEPAPDNRGAEGSTTPPYVRSETDPSLLGHTVTPVRVGELGPSFAACNARGTARNRPGSAASVPVRAAPYAQAAEIDALPPGAIFFICSRTQDQAWFGIIYDEGGQAAERCGVSGPIPARRDYRGPCAAGWAPSALVRLVSGVPHQLPPAPAPPAPPAP